LAEKPMPVTTTIQLSSERVASGLSQPLYVTSPPGDANRMFILEQKTGQIKILDLNTQTVAAQPFLTIPANDLLKNGFEQGLLGLAFHPNYAQNGKFYVSYTAPGGGNAGQAKVVEYQVSATDPNQADPTSAKQILAVNQPQENHNGGWIAFGADGYLYWAKGDGGGSGFQPGIPDESDNSQDITNNLLGKILRLDVNGDSFTRDPDRNYRIPASNPFVGKEGDDEIWVYGVRNPWRPSFDRQTGDLYIADVGQSSREEINFQRGNSPGGENYGWNRFEGSLPYKPGPPIANPVFPIYEYAHSVGRSVTGGYVYRGAVSELSGTYFFGDFSAGKIWSFRYTGNAVTQFSDRTGQLVPNVGSINQIASFGEDAAGNLYIVDLDGEIFRIEVKKNVVGDGQANNLGGGPSDDVLNGLAGSDTIRGLQGDDLLLGGSGRDSLDGGLGNDTIRGEDGNDTLLGSSGNDDLSGGGGDDRLIGGAALNSEGTVDRLTGNAGRDLFVLANSQGEFYIDNNLTPGNLGGYAIITDFNAADDRIRLKGSPSRYVLGTPPLFELNGTAIYFDRNNNRSLDGNDDFIAVVQNTSGLNLSASYFSYV
jgi:glucose/arabinose dehydrogenase